MNKIKPTTQYRNTHGDLTFFIRANSTSKVTAIPFDFTCDRQKIVWAQESFLQLPFVLHQERDQPLLVTNAKAAKDFCVILKHICEYWQAHLPSKPLWNWSEKELTLFIQLKMLKTKIFEHHSSPIYSNQRFQDIAQVLNTSHKARLSGKASDGLSFPITARLKRLIMEPILSDLDLTFEEWLRGQSHPPVPPGIVAVILNRAITILESDETAVALSLYSAWRKERKYHDQWFANKFGQPDIIELINKTETSYTTIKDELQKNNVAHITKLPWDSKTKFRAFRKRLIGACINIIFIQTGHRSHEFRSTLSNDRRLKRDHLFVKQSLIKSLDGLKVYRPLPKLSTCAAETLWNLSFIDPNLNPVPLQHALHETGYAKMALLDDIPADAMNAFENLSLNKRLNAFYQSDVLPIMPEAHSVHPSLSTHQFRHSFAEFSLRRFDEDVHESLREHFVHKSEYSTQVYEHGKLNPAVQSMLERNYLYELIGKAAEGKLDARFWGPAFQRIKSLIDGIKFLHPNKPKEHYHTIIDDVERFTVFEWGFCVLFISSKREAKCHDTVTGLPEIDSLATVSRCSGCPHNMGNSIQKKNLVRAELAYSEIGKTHPIKAIAKLCTDMADQISKRTRS